MRVCACMRERACAVLTNQVSIITLQARTNLSIPKYSGWSSLVFTCVQARARMCVCVCVRSRVKVDLEMLEKETFSCRESVLEGQQ